MYLVFHRTASLLHLLITLVEAEQSSGGNNMRSLKLHALIDKFTPTGTREVTAE